MSDQRVKAIPRPADRYRQDAIDVLEDAKGRGFESVIILGLMDGEIHTRSSETVSTLQIVGALEMAKAQLCNGGTGDG
ncbi:MAG: hypothetical protein KBE22_00150 [Candidatus Accumulibacter sp.]|nr:hypothetical protein [Accumulibacter sp.]